MERRDFLKSCGLLLVTAPTASRLLAMAPADSSCRYGMLIDLTRCPADCNACLTACRRENNVGFFGDKRWDIHWIRKVEIKRRHDEHASTKSVPVLCNHCDHPPCAQVCPVQATYKRADGIVIVDHHRCIGCRYCLIACPYNARFFNYRENEEWSNIDYPKRSHGVAESCNLCAHRLDQGLLPACVEACRNSGAHALVVGNLDDPDSEISRQIAVNSVQRIRADLGTEPKVYYIGL
jgi:molybdopterin-containing oxidoreductase family iron-sulfur binding subunit